MVWRGWAEYDVRCVAYFSWDIRRDEYFGGFHGILPFCGKKTEAVIGCFAQGLGSGGGGAVI